MLKQYLTLVVVASLAGSTIHAATLEIDERVQLSLKLERATADAHKDYAEQMEYVHNNVRPECKEFAIQYLSMAQEWNVGALTGHGMTCSKLSTEAHGMLKKHLLDQVNAFCAQMLVRDQN